MGYRPYRTFTFSGPAFQPVLSAMSAFARRYSRSRSCFPFLRVLRCFSSPGSPHTPMHSARDTPKGGLPHSEILRSQLGYQLPQAYRRFQRPSSPLDAKSSAMRPSWSDHSYLTPRTQPDESDSDHDRKSSVHAQDRINAPSSFQGKRGCRGEPLTPSWTIQPPIGSACIRSTAPAHYATRYSHLQAPPTRRNGSDDDSTSRRILAGPQTLPVDIRFSKSPVAAGSTDAIHAVRTASAPFPSVFTPGLEARGC